MPVFMRIAGYKIYFWSNESGEPVHFHVAKGNPLENDTKVWLLSNGSFKPAHNKGNIPQKDLTRILSIMQPYYFDFINLWKEYSKSDVQFYE